MSLARNRRRRRVLVRGDDVWFTCIPDLWHIRGARAVRMSNRRAERSDATSREKPDGFGVTSRMAGMTCMA